MSLLEIKDLSIHFGGVKAVQNVTFSVEEGDFIGLIGPNGAGKTTVFNAVTGVVLPTLGEIYFDGHRLNGMRPDRISHLGIARTFQNIRIYPRMTALENVAIGLDSRASYNTVSAMLRLPHVVKRDKEIKQTCLQYLDQVGILQHRDTEVGSLPYGLQRKVEIARALATGPKLLFLDEPAAGMNTAESLELVSFLRQLHQETGIAIVLIEHHLEVVMEVCQSIQVLNLGQLLASGTPEEIQKNPDVIKAYLGERRKRGGEAN
ncbi:MAG: ABC transporter ATP-binding protein [Clostridium sp.]|nr:ABC transporter ATP-binding protein [Enterocloster asparagiformis]MCD7909502.1 ABC transporter ATP-binding protein [Clostridium sp.]